ncbi:MAG: hypothetical protein GX416_12190 [Bacteroidales bacterium]|nr:hypothetical protein [Bacteroidales bacterium]
MNDKEILKGTAFHEAGHVLAIYIVCGNINCVEFSRIESINEKDPPDRVYGGSTKLLEEPNDVLDSIKELPAFKKFGVDFIMACYYFGGGVAEMIMMKQEQLNENSMRYDVDQFGRRDIQNCGELRELAISFCKEEFLQMKHYLQAIADKLIETSIKDAGGIDMGLGRYELFALLND